MKTVEYVVYYIICMIPTYILPYMGSNSMFTAGVQQMGNKGSVALTLFCVHAVILCMACWLAWMRGKTTQKTWLVVFPILATVFDLVPFLSMIPLVPTAMHLCAIIVGVQPPRQTQDQQSS
jgi:hypothetical protein